MLFRSLEVVELDGIEGLLAEKRRTAALATAQAPPESLVLLDLGR